MATQTTKRSLLKPERTDFVNVITDISDNMENLDNAVPDTIEINGHPLTNDITITKADINLGNVDNTADVDKPVSTAQQTALDGKADLVAGATNGNFASLNASGNLADSGYSSSDFATVITLVSGDDYMIQV